MQHCLIIYGYLIWFKNNFEISSSKKKKGKDEYLDRHDLYFRLFEGALNAKIFSYYHNTIHYRLNLFEIDHDMYKEIKKVFSSYITKFSSIKLRDWLKKKKQIWLNKKKTYLVFSPILFR